MYNHSSWEKQNYEKIFESTCVYVDERRKKERDFNIEKLEKMLEMVYVRKGNDWVGKGPVKNIEDSAIIAAFEHKLAEWKKEKQKD